MANAAPVGIDVQVSGRVTVTRLSKWDDDVWTVIAMRKGGVGTYTPKPALDLGSPKKVGGFDGVGNGGDLALAQLKQRRPNWFRKDIEYPEEDFSIGDLSGVDVDVED
jgi:hypothetical protein